MPTHPTPRLFDSALLFSILAQPSAPFREGHVISHIREALDETTVPYFLDPIGNLILGATNQKDYLALLREKSEEPVRVFIAHMDHPGFHGTSWKSATQLEVKWHGGSPTQHIEGARVWLASQKHFLAYGKFASVKMIPSGRAIESGVIEIDSELALAMKTHNPEGPEVYGGFGFREPVWQEGELIYTKAADDLVGAFAIVSLAIEYFGQAPNAPLKAAKKTAKTRAKKSAVKPRPPFLGLLTRAEEVGFIGAIGHFELGWLQTAKRPVLGVSLETSRTLPGADIGKGPVVRLGDRSTVFDSSALRVFSELARTSLPELHQRRVMDGGTCEATAATAYGIPCVGISVPLGNYHNQSFEGGPDSAGPLGPAPEFVHLQDIQGLMELCRGLLQAKLPWANAWGSKLKEFKKELRGYRALLRSGP